MAGKEYQQLTLDDALVIRNGLVAPGCLVAVVMSEVSAIRGPLAPHKVMCGQTGYECLVAKSLSSIRGTDRAIMQSCPKGIGNPVFQQLAQKVGR